MSTEVTRVVIGDYQYRLYDDQTARAKVTDTSKASYGALQASVTHEGVTYALTSMVQCFYGCYSLTTAPEIPSGVTNMSYCFTQCTALTTAPSIPSSVTNLSSCFTGCTSLTTAPSIPSSVTILGGCFYRCAALTGTIAVHGTPTSYVSCFQNTTQPIVLVVYDTGTAPTWTQVAATGNNGNVTVRDVSANPAPTATITAVRVASSGSTTPDETGQYAYVTVRTTASTEQAPDNVAQAPTITLDGSAYTPLSPSGTDTYTCWVALGDEAKHVIGATPRDTYKTGTEVTVTLASTYSPMEFYQGGTGASFGKHATRSGVLDVAWDVESDGDVSAAGDMSGASVSATGDVTAGGKITADGEVAGSDCKSANYSLEDVGDSISQVTSYTATRTSKTTGGSAKYTRWGPQVVANISLNCSAITRLDVLATGLPIPNATGADGVLATNNNRVLPVYVDASGRLVAAQTAAAAWYAGQVVYFVD